MITSLFTVSPSIPMTKDPDLQMCSLCTPCSRDLCVYTVIGAAFIVRLPWRILVTILICSVWLTLHASLTRLHGLRALLAFGMNFERTAVPETCAASVCVSQCPIAFICAAFARPQHPHCKQKDSTMHSITSQELRAQPKSHVQHLLMSKMKTSSSALLPLSTW